MDTPKELSPLAKGDIEIGKALPFAIYDRQGVLLLAEGQAITSTKQLDELATKGLYHNPRWASSLSIQNKATMGTVSPTVLARMQVSKASIQDPSETGSFLKMNLPGQADVFPVRLVGALGRAAFVISHPMKDEACIFTKEGQVWEFKTFYGLSIYRFSAMVEKVLLSPYPMLVMSWPQETHLESKPIRATRRAWCEVPATLKNAQGQSAGELYNGVIHNISTGGLEFESLAPCKLRERAEVQVAFQLFLQDRRYLLELKARVMSVQSSPVAQGSVFGLAFEPLPDDLFSVVHGYVCDRLVRKLESPLYTKD